MMMDDSTIFQEEQIQNRIMEILENEPFLTCLFLGQSTSTRNFVAEQILGNWLEVYYRRTLKSTLWILNYRS